MVCHNQNSYDSQGISCNHTYLLSSCIFQLNRWINFAWLDNSSTDRHYLIRRYTFLTSIYREPTKSKVFTNVISNLMIGQRCRTSLVANLQSKLYWLPSDSITCASSVGQVSYYTKGNWQLAIPLASFHKLGTPAG